MAQRISRMELGNISLLYIWKLSFDNFMGDIMPNVLAGKYCDALPLTLSQLL